MKLSKAKEKLELAEIEARLERLILAAKECDEKSKELFEALSDDDEEDGESLLEELRIKIKHNYSIPHGVVFLGSETGWCSGDDTLFMRFAKWWIQGAMSEDMFDLFYFHYEETIELDYGWILTDRPSFYYSDDVTRQDFDAREKMLRDIGTRDKSKNACINFKLRMGHGDYIRHGSKSDL